MDGPLGKRKTRAPESNLAQDSDGRACKSVMGQGTGGAKGQEALKEHCQSVMSRKGRQEMMMMMMTTKVSRIRYLNS